MDCRKELVRMLIGYGHARQVAENIGSEFIVPQSVHTAVEQLRQKGMSDAELVLQGVHKDFLVNETT